MVFVDMITLAYVLRQRYRQSCAQTVQAAASQSRNRCVASIKTLLELSLSRVAVQSSLLNLPEKLATLSRRQCARSLHPLQGVLAAGASKVTSVTRFRFKNASQKNATCEKLTHDMALR